MSSMSKAGQERMEVLLVARRLIREGSAEWIRAHATTGMNIRPDGTTKAGPIEPRSVYLDPSSCISKLVAMSAVAREFDLLRIVEGSNKGGTLIGANRGPVG